MKCDEGYPCEVCGQPVETITESDLYLRYVLGEVSPDRLPYSPERHLRCNPAIAQFIVDDDFEPVVAEGPFAKDGFDETERERLETRYTRAWQRLREVQQQPRPVEEYPLPPNER